MSISQAKIGSIIEYREFASGTGNYRHGEHRAYIGNGECVAWETFEGEVGSVTVHDTNENAIGHFYLHGLRKINR